MIEQFFLYERTTKKDSWFIGNKYRHSGGYFDTQSFERFMLRWDRNCFTLEGDLMLPTEFFNIN